MRPALAWLAAGTLAMLASLSPTPSAQAQPQGGGTRAAASSG